MVTEESEREYKFLVARTAGGAETEATGHRDSSWGRNRPKTGAVQQAAAPLNCYTLQSLACQRKKSKEKGATAMRWKGGEEQQQDSTMDRNNVHFDFEQNMDFENLAGLDLATLKRQLRLPIIRGSPKRGSDSRSGTWP